MDDDRYDNRPRSRDSRDSRDRDSRDSRDSRDRDYYPRRGGRGYRGRGGGRNYYNKRDNYYNDRYEHDDRSEKRRKYDPVDESEKKLKSLIVRVGDHSASDTLSSQLEALANELDSDMSKYKQVILDTLSQSILALPSKTSVYGTLVGLLNLKNFEVGKEVVLKVSATIQDCLDKHKFNELKLLFRFVGELVNSNVVLPSGILDVFNQCLTTLHDETNPKKSDYFAFLVMQTLPWVGRELNQRKADDLSKIMGQLEYYIQRRQKPNPILCVFEVDSNEDILNVLWSQLEKLREEGWSVTSILKPYTSFEKLNSSLQHTLPSIKVPLYNYETQFPTIRTKFRLFDSSDTESEIRPIDRFVIEDTIIDILKLWSSSHKDATTHIQSLPLSTDIDYLAIETIFGELFALPNPSHKPVYYGVVLMDYLKSKPTVAPVLGLAIATLFDRLSEMDVECVDRFTSWFSHHLSNFDYKWDWPAWDNVLTEKNEGIQLYCVKEILEKCLRLSYHERIKKTLPEEFHKLLPEPIIASMKYDLPENNSDKDYNSKINVLIDKFKNKLRSEEIQHGYLETEEFMEFTRDDKLEIIIYSILKSGSKSFSHFLATVERYLSLINAYITTSEDKIHVIKTVREFWFRSPQNIIIQIDKLMTYRVIDNIAIINWLFSQDELPNLTKGYMWEILYNTINKTLARTETIREELQDAEADLQKVPPESQTDDHPEVRRVKLRRETHDSALRESKELFLIIFQHFCLSLTEHLTQSEANGTDPNTFWFHITLGHLKATGRRYFKEISPFLTTLETLLFMNADQRLQNVFQLIKSI